MTEPVNDSDLEQEVTQAAALWRTELEDHIKVLEAERADKGPQPQPVHNLDDIVFTPEFLDKDLQLALVYITSTMKLIRATPGWKAKDLALYKKWRQILLVERQKVKGMAGLTEEQNHHIKQVIGKFYQELHAKAD